MLCRVLFVCRTAGMQGYRMEGKSLTVSIAGQKDPPRHRAGLGFDRGDRDRHHGHRHDHHHGPPGGPPGEGDC
jgi:hypothetical protein